MARRVVRGQDAKRAGLCMTGVRKRFRYVRKRHSQNPPEGTLRLWRRETASNVTALKRAAASASHNAHRHHDHHSATLPSS
ncbi:hypothetical protein LMG28688_04446 [Paraburkholderia caffeinitolerans]|uniref:Uncharacterized protein n=1 Tax=Paraburkholderia caffeinitolerans TaxID=1723730 RepID=A0A6J5GAT9_9BURK|nr:hypothetical protein LMG28688_04446 [Paraburkholderia caffeinitolerans]